MVTRSRSRASRSTAAFSLRDISRVYCASALLRSATSQSSLRVGPQQTALIVGGSGGYHFCVECCIFPHLCFPIVCSVRCLTPPTNRRLVLVSDEFVPDFRLEFGPFLRECEGLVNEGGVGIPGLSPASVRDVSPPTVVLGNPSFATAAREPCRSPPL